MCIRDSVFTLANLRYVKTRFTLPIVLLLAILVGLGLARWPRGRTRNACLVGAALLLGLGLARCLRMADWMENDPRYAAESFLAEALEPGDQVELYADDHYLPRLHIAGLNATHIAPEDMTLAGLKQRAPRAIILAPAYHWKLDDKTREYIHWLRDQPDYKVHTFKGHAAPKFLSLDTATVLFPTIQVLLR